MSPMYQMSFRGHRRVIERSFVKDLSKCAGQWEFPIFTMIVSNWLNCVDLKFHANTLIWLLFIAKMPGIVFLLLLVVIYMLWNKRKQTRIKTLQCKYEGMYIVMYICMEFMN